MRSQWGVGETDDVQKFSNFGPEGFQNFEISLSPHLLKSLLINNY